jgi:hypothetical protein
MGRDSGCSAGAVPRANNDGTNTWACSDAPRIAGDIGGTYSAPTIVSTHLSAVLPEGQGGTGAGSTTCSAGQALTSNGSAYSCTSTLTANAYSGTLPIANGGTNTTNTPINGGSAYGTGSALAWTAAGTANQHLISNGAAAPTWADAPLMVKLAATVSTTSATVPTTVVTFPAPANAYVYFYCQLITAGTTTASAKFNWNYPTNGGTFLTTWTKWLTSTTLPVWETISMATPANWTTGCTAGCLVPAWLVWTVSGGYSNGTSSGSLTLQLESATAGQTVQVYAGSGCVYY